MHRITTTLAAAAVAVLPVATAAQELALSYFMGPKHPMNAAVFTPFAEKLAEVSGGAMTVTQYPGGALNSAPPKQYEILLEGVADVAFHLPGYTQQLFPMTNVIEVPGLCADAVDCTEALIRAKATLETEYDARLLAIWTNSPPVLITRDVPVRTLEDLAGLKLRVTSASQVPFVEALGASAVSQPASVLNQNLSNGVIDGVIIGASGIGSFKLQEAGNYLTTWFPGSGSAFVLLMNRGVYDGLSDEQKGWIDAASGDWLSLSGAEGYMAADDEGIEVARAAGNEIIDLSDAEKARFEAAMEAPTEAFLASSITDDMTGADLVALMKGEGS